MQNLPQPPQPPAYPEKVYKFRDWGNEYHRRTLTHKELFLSSPANFNDPFDCKIPVAHWKVTEDQQFAIAYFTDFVQRNFPDASCEAQKQEVNRLLDEFTNKDPQWFKEKDEEFYDEIDNNYGIITFCQNKDDSRMWAHYSAAHTGFCVGFYSYPLFFGNRERFGTGGKVLYEKRFPEISPMQDHAKQIMNVLYTKHDIWEYENEYRLTKIYSPNQVVNFYENEIAEVNLGIAIPDNYVKEIVEICQENFPDIPVYKAYGKRLSFEIEFERIV